MQPQFEEEIVVLARAFNRAYKKHQEGVAAAQKAAPATATTATASAAVAAFTPFEKESLRIQREMLQLQRETVRLLGLLVQQQQQQ